MKKKSKKKSSKNLKWLKAQQPLMQLDLLQNHLSLCQILLTELLEEEVIRKAGKRYSRKKSHKDTYSRWGYNPGSVQIGDQRLKMSIPRIRDDESLRFESLDTYDQIKRIESPSEQLIKGVLLGLSMRDYEGVIDNMSEGFGLKKSSVSRSFIERSKEKLEEFESRSLESYDFVSLFIDGKYLAKEQIMIVLGVTLDGRKIPIGFSQMHSENSKPIAELFRNLIKRGLKYDQGLLFVIDGAKGIRKAVEDVFDNKAVIQRCTWHKCENVQKYLNQTDQKWFKSEYYSALDRAKYKDAKNDIEALIKQLADKNLSASRSLQEGVEEILTLHKLKINTEIKRSFHTTNVIENLNSQLEKYIRKVKNWQNSEMRYRWIGSALLEIETKMNKISNYKKMPLLRKAIKNYIAEPSLTTETVSTKIGT